MNDHDKTKAQLIEELETLRRRFSELESRLAASEQTTGSGAEGLKSRAPRVGINAAIEFIGDFDIVQARGIDISEGGICFELAQDLPFEMQFEHEGTRHLYRAHLIWMKQLPEGGYRLGFRFTDPKPHQTL